MTNCQPRPECPCRGKKILGAVLLSCVLMSHAESASPDRQDVSAARDILRELIETRSTHDVGTTEVARKVQALLLAGGFAASDVQLLIPPDQPDAGNVVVRLHGRGRGKPVLYLCHLDVVAANPADWTRDPFRLTEDGGWLYGRGTIDMKGQDAAVLAALLRFKRERFVPDRDILNTTT
jgi:acetylornithine deacetylase/succinyl-diaminopimelate desuccinylase-like protein